jgi:hypothetical protein
MDSALRPMSTSEVLDRTFHLYRNHFITLAGIGILLPALYLILQLMFLHFGYVAGSADSQSDVDYVPLTLFYAVCTVVIFVFGYSLVSGATFHAVSRLHLGQRVTILECYRKVCSRFPTVFRIVISLCIRAIGPFVASFFGFVALGMALRRMVGSLGRSALPVIIASVWILVFAALFWTLYIYIKYSMSVAACMAEKLRAREALKRSRFLTKKTKWRIFLVFLLMGIIGVALNYAFTAPSEYYSLEHNGKLTVSWAIWEYVGGFLAGTLAGPISTIAITLVYYDQRVRKEAFDLQFMLENLNELQPQHNAVGAG